MQRKQCGAAMGLSHPICGDVYSIRLRRVYSIITASLGMLILNAVLTPISCKMGFYLRALTGLTLFETDRLWNTCIISIWVAHAASPRLHSLPSFVHALWVHCNDSEYAHFQLCMQGLQQVAPSPVPVDEPAPTLAPVLVGLVSMVDATVLLGIGYVIERMGGRYERVLRGIDSIFLEDVI